MPYKSNAQRKFMHAKHPNIAKKWDEETRRAPVRAKKEFPKGEATRVKRNYQPVKGSIRPAVGDPDRTQSINELKNKARPQKQFPTGEATRVKREYPVIRPGVPKGNVDSSFRDYMQGKRQGFNPYAAGQKRYGLGARSAPNIGPTGSPEGYDMRERKNNAKRNAMLRKMKSTQSGRHMSPDALRRKNYGG